MLPLPSVTLAVGVHWQKWPAITACGIMIEPHRRVTGRAPVTCLNCLPLIRSERQVLYTLDVTFDGTPRVAKAAFLKGVSPDQPFTNFDEAAAWRSRLAQRTRRYTRELGVKPTFTIIARVPTCAPGVRSDNA